MRGVWVGLLLVSACGEAAPASSRASREPAASPRARADERESTPQPTIASNGCVEAVPELGPEVARGVCYAHEYRDHGARGYGSETSRASLEELRALGVDTISLTPFAFMPSVDSPEIRLADSHPGAETDERLAREVASCGALGLRVMLKPHLWIRGGAWVGTIDMADDEAWARWQRSYRAFVLHYARFAAEHALPSFVIGVELDPIVIRFEAFFRALVPEVRAIYDGEILYAANWDRAVDVRLWDAVDAIGVQFYPPLADVPEAPRADLDARLAHYMTVLDALHRRTNKAIVFTEVGYRSAPGAEVRPHAWPEHDAERLVSLSTQRRAYEAFFASLRGRAFVRGIYVWKWFTDPATRDEGPDGFSPRGKPAEAVLRAAYRGCD
ncbi:MAG: hypothetical protein H6722_28800 [Sandaracinus sp.]|nr:hypothetical protein [Myxococcales bacterium]MCB9616453.1 hypothetical protein [Sandaracinus sp.]